MTEAKFRKLLHSKFAAMVHVQAIELGLHELHKFLPGDAPIFRDTGRERDPAIIAPDGRSGNKQYHD